MRIVWMLALISAAIYALAFPPVSLGPLMWLALAPLFAACVRVTPGRAALLAGVFAVLAAGGVAYWLPDMLRDFFGVPASWALGGAAAVFVVFAGSYWALFGAWLSWVARRGWASPLVVAAGFVACEFARANGLVPNPWALSAHSQLGSPLVQAADLAGPYGLALLVGGVNAALAGLFVPALRSGSRLRTMAGAALALACVWGYCVFRLAQPIGDPARAIAVEVVHLPADASPGAVPFAAPSRPPDLVLWPESAVDFALREPSAATNALLRTARASGADWLVGGPDERSGYGRSHSFNSMFLIRRGRLSAQLDKVRLMPFAESNPLRGWIELDRTELTPGARIRTLPLGATRFGTAICSEAMDPHYVRELVAAGAEWIANPAKDRWFGDPAAAEMQLAATRLRAIESRRFVARAAAGGVSAVVDPWGRVVARADGAEPARIAATLEPSTLETPYQRIGDRPAWLAVAIALVVAVLPPRRTRHSLPPRRSRRPFEVPRP
ncbi:MAG: apolipoprotein N-acyltransferase [Myxococcota bacterium]